MKITQGYVITKKFQSANEFSIYIETLCEQKKIGFMEAIIDYCEQNDIDVESIASLINKSLRQKIRTEAENLNIIKSTGKLVF